MIHGRQSAVQNSAVRCDDTRAEIEQGSVKIEEDDART